MACLWGPHSGECSDCRLLGCDTVQSCKWTQRLRRNILHLLTRPILNTEAVCPSETLISAYMTNVSQPGMTISSSSSQGVVPLPTSFIQHDIQNSITNRSKNSINASQGLPVSNASRCFTLYLRRLLKYVSRRMILNKEPRVI
jgi:hypothetical protein